MGEANLEREVQNRLHRKKKMLQRAMSYIVYLTYCPWTSLSFSRFKEESSPPIGSGFSLGGQMR